MSVDLIIAFHSVRLTHSSSAFFFSRVVANPIEILKEEACCASSASVPVRLYFHCSFLGCRGEHCGRLPDSPISQPIHPLNRCPITTRHDSIRLPFWAVTRSAQRHRSRASSGAVALSSTPDHHHRHQSNKKKY